MTRVDFYVVENPNEHQYGRLVCRLAERAWREGHCVHIHCNEAAAATALDDLLWTYKDTSFLPHALLHACADRDVPITIGCNEDVPPTHDVLINLGAEVPGFFSRFERVMETTGVDADARTAARRRYRFYQERGYALKTHKLDKRGG